MRVKVANPRDLSDCRIHSSYFPIHCIALAS